MSEVIMPTQEQIQEWKEKFKKIAQLEAFNDATGETLKIIVKKPSRGSFDRYQEDVIKKAPVKAMTQFVLENTLFPSGEELKKVFAEKPGFIGSIATPLQEMAGVGTDFSVTEL